MAGTTTNATSISPGTAVTLGYATTPWTTAALGFTGYTGPWNPDISRLWKRRPPIDEASRDAPITATDRGERNVRIAFTAASVSRCSNRSTASSVSRIGNSTSIDPGIARIETVNPLARKRLIMPWFSGRTSATNVVMSCRAASCASWPNRIEPMPLPWKSSVTERLISARPPSIRKYWAPPIIRPWSPPWSTSNVRWSA